VRCGEARALGLGSLLLRVDVRRLHVTAEKEDRADAGAREDGGLREAGHCKKCAGTQFFSFHLQEGGYVICTI
jgi:hypothetical protein